jgi:hypothetical protein
MRDINDALSYQSSSAVSQHNSIMHLSNTLIHHFASNWIVCVHLDGDEGWIDKV